jgi:hypothetical protein
MQIKTLCLVTYFTISLFSGVRAQDAAPGPGSVTVFSEDGENFTLYLNGEQKNGSPASRIVVNITEEQVSFRIVFQNSTTPEVKRSGLRGGAHCMYAIEKNKKNERVLKIKGCSEEPAAADGQYSSQNSETATSEVTSVTEVVSTSGVTSTPAQLSATHKDGVITINDGRIFSVKKIKANGMTYPRVMMTILEGAHVSIAYDNNSEKYNAEVPFEYEVKDFSNNNAYFTLTVDEGGPAKTWRVKLQNNNGYDLRIE